MQLRVNGQQRESNAAPGDTLIHVLRQEFGLVGAKLGCGKEQCGACVVLVDGRPTYACTALVEEVSAADIETVEGLGIAGALSVLQQAFLRENAGQCGFCLAGIVVRAEALLRSSPQPTREEICAALDPHLCRCGSHPRIIRAVQRASAERSEDGA